jgi:hypothetical protein
MDFGLQPKMRVRTPEQKEKGSGLGSFADSPERLRYAAAYLER